MRTWLFVFGTVQSAAEAIESLKLFESLQTLNCRVFEIVLYILVTAKKVHIKLLRIVYWLSFSKASFLGGALHPALQQQDGGHYQNRSYGIRDSFWNIVLTNYLQE